MQSSRGFRMKPSKHGKVHRLHLLIIYGLPIHTPAVLGRFKTKPCALGFIS